MIHQFPTDTSQFILPGPAGDLEVLTTYPQSMNPPAVAIICHPHPLYAGTMNNKVVTTSARAFEHLGFATLRFNFRGVGKSTGEYGHVTGEIEDLKSMVAWVNHSLPGIPLSLAGFSFGACVAANVANQTQVLQLITIAPAVNHCDFQHLFQIRCPWLVIQGDQDEVVPFDQVQTFANHPPAPLKFIIMKEAGHFFHGRLIELREILEKNILAP